MYESAVYNESDLAPFRARLEELRRLIHNDNEGKHPKSLVKLLDRQLSECGESRIDHKNDELGFIIGSIFRRSCRTIECFPCSSLC